MNNLVCMNHVDFAEEQVYTVIYQTKRLEDKMAISGYAWIGQSRNGVHITCTDEKLIERILEELKKLIPSYQIAETGSRQLISGEVFETWVHKLQDKDYLVAFWVLKQFTLRGWEPFSTHGEGITEAFSSMHLRFVGKRTEEVKE